MKFQTTTLQGVWLIECEPHEDERGFLSRTFCEREFAAHGLNTRWTQCSLTLTRKRGMLRGLHYQADPRPETRLIRCASGAIWDVLADLRPDSLTFRKWEAFELTDRNLRQLYAPGGIAHGFQCLSDDCEVYYQMSELYEPELARGVRWNDPTLSISWPVPNPILSDRDRSLPPLGAP